jgi:TRAP-type C4-dicarboxylate transport system permease small subunit
MEKDSQLRANLKHLDRAEEYSACFLLLVLFVLLTVTIVLRFAFSLGFSWMEEIARVIFVWIVMLGAAAAMRTKVHIRLTFGIDLLPAGLGKAAELLGNILLLAFCMATAWYGLILVQSTMQVSYTMPSSGMSMFWAYLSVPVSFGLQAVRLLLRGAGLTTAEEG